MADNTTLNTGAGGDVISTDDIAGVKVQRVKVQYGADGSATDVSATTPLPAYAPDVTSSGSITAVSGSVVLALSGHSSATIRVSGTWVGTLQFEASDDGTTWDAINATVASTSTPSTTGTVNGMYRLGIGAFQQFRVVSTAWTSGTATILMRASLGVAAIFANQILPTKLYDGTNLATIFPATFLRTTDEPRQIFYDPFDAAPDTTNVWTSTTGNSGVAAAVSAGVLSLGTGTTANGFSKIVSIPTFKLPIPGWLGDSFAIALPDGAAPISNAARYWGLFTAPASPTVAAPLTDGYAFELSSTGRLSAVVYASGARTSIADLGTTAGGGTGTQPLDASYHRYIIYVRTDKTYFYIDGLSPANLVATTNFQAPAIQTLPTSLLAIGNTPTAPVSNTQIQCAGLAVWDTGKNATQIADGTFPFRKLKVNSDGSVQLSTGAAQDGTDITTPTAMPAGGVGIRGWLSAIWTKLNGTLGVTGTFWQATQPVSGTFFQATQPVSLATNTPDITDRAARLLGVVTVASSAKATYSASTSAVLVAPITTPSPFFTIYGSATKTIRVESIVVSGLTLTAVQYLNIGTRKFSTAPSAGTSTALTQIPFDTNSAAGTATNINAYTVAPTAGTSVGDLSSRRVMGQSTTAAAAGIPQIVDFDFNAIDGTSPILRGTAQGIGLYWIATAPATAVSMLVRVIWTEE